MSACSVALGSPFRLPALLTPQHSRVGCPEDVAPASCDPAEDTAGQSRLGLHDEVHGVMGQVIVVARTVPRGQLRCAVSDDRHPVAPPGRFGERHVHRCHGIRVTGKRGTGFPLHQSTTRAREPAVPARDAMTCGDVRNAETLQVALAPLPKRAFRLVRRVVRARQPAAPRLRRCQLPVLFCCPAHGRPAGNPVSPERPARLWQFRAYRVIYG
jgi:hypothetical protein